jgi:hypothetical protein
VDDEAWLQSMHTQSFAKVTATRLDPSLALGFYCRHAIDFDALQRSLKQVRTVQKDPINNSSG